MSPAKVLMKLGSPGEAFYAYNGYRNVTIEGGTLDGNHLSAKLFEGVHAKNISFIGVTFQNVKEAHHVEMAAVKNILVKNCTFKGYSGKETSNMEALQFDVLVSEHFPSGHYDDTPSQDIKVTGCTFTNLRCGVGTHSAIAGSYFTNIEISNNKFSNISQYAISAMNYRSSKITKNTISSCGSGIWVRTMTSSHTNFYMPSKGGISLNSNAGILVSDNTITVNNSKISVGFGISAYGEKLTKASGKIKAGDYRISNVTVQNNKITLKTKGYGIWVRGVLNSSVKKNKVTSSLPSNASGTGSGDCVRIDTCSNITASGNTLKNTQKNSKNKDLNGFSVLKTKKARLSKNTILGARKAGIHVVDSSSVTASNNTIKSSGIYSMFVARKSSLKVSGNKLTKWGKKALQQSEGGKLTGSDGAGSSITSFSVKGRKGSIKGRKITLTLKKGTKVTSLKPVIKVSKYAVVSPKSKAKVNLTDPVKYKVTSASGKTKTYTVQVKFK